MLDTLVMNNKLMKLVSQAREKANLNGEIFNIFSILKVHRNEAGTHSRFLHELLNPQGRHGEGTAFLDLFLDGVLDIQQEIKGHYRIKRELPTEEKRRVDIVIESAHDIVGIELKIDATDQNAQLYDYYQELLRRADGRKSVTLAYLTLDGKSPSSISLNGLSKDKVVCLSFAYHVSGWLQDCIEASQHKPILAHAIQQYQQTINNLTGEGGGVSDLIAGGLNTDIEKFKDALLVEESLPKAKASIQELFWKELSEALESKLGTMPSVYGGKSIASISRDYYSKNKNNKHVGIKMPICRLGDKNVCLYVNLYNAVHYGLRVENESGAIIPSPDLRELFRKEIGRGNAAADSHADWLVCYYYNPANGDSEKAINFDAFNSAAVSLLDEELRRALITDMVSHQAELASKAIEMTSSWGHRRQEE
ncbi:PDDEXK-like family protein [Phytohalomonas tamaricis]|uniref:PDDEXK-like family protein n=1 Tax=Phytohalomonas tamaricis TaxID=2081032 RepID=UPI000D0B4A06|nr:PD-(D/E)XK nuclease family protein [Phytohalomonas tamaricis]